MVAEIGGTLIFSLVSAPLLSVAVVVFIIVLCAGRKKDEDIEDGVLKSSGSYTRKSDEPFGETEKLETSKPENEVHATSKSADIIVNPAVDANFDAADTMVVTENQLYAVARPREPSPNLHRKSIEGLPETSGQYDTAGDGRTKFIENSDNAEVSADAMYARVSSVRRQEPEIAYSVVELKDRGEEYEFVNNRLKRKGSQDLVAPVIPANESDQSLSTTYAVVKDERKEDFNKRFSDSTPEPNTSDIYSKVDESPDVNEPRRSSEGTKVERKESEGGDLYATVTEAPKHNSLPQSSKGGLSKFSIFKQSKRRSRTVDETSTASNDSQKVAERRSSKRKHINIGKSKTETEDATSRSPPPPPPPPPVESLKSIAKDVNRRRSGAEDQGAKSREATPTNSPRLGALPSIPVTQFKFDKPATEDYDDDDGMYEQLGIGAAKVTTPPNKIQTGYPQMGKEVDQAAYRVPETKRTLSQESRKSLNESLNADTNVSPPTSVHDRANGTNIYRDEDVGFKPTVMDIYAQVDKKRSSSKSDNEFQPEVVAKTTCHDFPSLDVYAQVNKKKLEKMGAKCKSADNMDVSSVRTDPSGIGDPHNVVDTTTANGSIIDGKSRRSHSEVEWYSEHKIIVTPSEDSELDSQTDQLVKRRAFTTPIPDELLDPSLKKNVYAQVNLDKKRESRKVGETYAKVNKVSTGKMTFHQTPIPQESESETLYEGAYNVISETSTKEAEKIEEEEDGYVTAANPLGKQSSTVIPSNLYSLPDKQVDDNDEDTYERVDDLK